MTMAMPDLRARPGRILVVGDGDSTLAASLRSLGHTVCELLPSDFHGQCDEMVDVVAVLPDCADSQRIGAVAAACAQCVWFQERPAPPGLAELLLAAGVPLVESKDLLQECR